MGDLSRAFCLPLQVSHLCHIAVCRVTCRIQYSIEDYPNLHCLIHSTLIHYDRHIEKKFRVAEAEKDSKHTHSVTGRSRFQVLLFQINSHYNCSQGVLIGPLIVLLLVMHSFCYCLGCSNSITDSY